MKLSEMTGDQLATCLCIISPCAERIAEDDEIVDVIKGCMSVREVEGEKLRYLDIPRAVLRMIPVLLTKHKRDTFTILGAMNGKTADEIAQQNGLKMLAEIKAVFDADMLSFFISSGSGA